MSDTNTLYDEDFFAWTRHQAKALRAASRSLTNQPLDWKHLAEEIEDLGKSDRRELGSQIRRIIHHLVKLQRSPASDPRTDWEVSIRDARAEVRALLKDSPSLKRQVPRLIIEQTGDALELAILDLRKFGELDPADLGTLRQTCYTVEQVLGDWLPGPPARGD
ncbi:MAG TPA: DUF29 domain-containing protein [Stellaceae bacterium]|nr:DUF29 domain-containing protein [Stellaceae bacterium]